MDDLPLYPIWRDVLRRWPEYGYTWGDTVPHKWFFDVFELPEVLDTMTVKDAQRIELKMLGYRTEFMRALLSERNMYLVSVPGVGYEIVTPGEQGRRAYDDFQSTMRKATRDLADRLQHTNTAMLSADDQREHTRLLSKAGSIARWVKDIITRLLPGDSE
jgi:hypothetical protein